ncbi:hypothetical protein XarjCFBP8253_10970 [Xanthomonas arboricola pv. juglandis]|nr:hypothetical protein XarjCFBP8253_10970 [Xanthomonas arboricola pv. juglandis]
MQAIPLKESRSMPCGESSRHAHAFAWQVIATKREWAWHPAEAVTACCVAGCHVAGASAYRHERSMHPPIQSPTEADAWPRVA